MNFKWVEISDIPLEHSSALYIHPQGSQYFTLSVKDDKGALRYLTSSPPSKETLQNVTDNGNETDNSIIVQGAIYQSDKTRKSISISEKPFLDENITESVFQGHSIFKSLESDPDPIWSPTNKRYVAMGTDIFNDFVGNLSYRPTHNVHDSWVGIGSNLAFGAKDGTNVTLVGTTLFYLNDIPIWDSVTSIGKGNTNAKLPYGSDPNRVAISSNGINLREMMASVTMVGNENWFGDIHSSTIVGTSTRTWRYAFNSIVLGFENMCDFTETLEDRFLDSDVIIGNGVIKRLSRHDRTHNLLIGSQYGRGNSGPGGGYDDNYIALVEGNFKRPYFRINGLFQVNNSFTRIDDTNDGSSLIHSSYDVTTPLRQRTYISGRNNLNAEIHSNPLSGFGGFIMSGVNNFKLLGTDVTNVDPMDSITVYGQRNGQFHKKGTNIWSFGTAGHMTFANPMRDCFNVGVLGLGRGLTQEESFTTPTSNKVQTYNEGIVNTGSNYPRFAYNAVINGYGNDNVKILADSVIVGNKNGFANLDIGFTQNIDSSIIIGHSLLNETTYTTFKNNYNFKVGIGTRLFLEGYYGDAEEKFTKLKGKIILDERLQLQTYSKVQRNALPNPEKGQMIWQEESGNSGIRVYDGTNWLAIATTID